MATVESKPAAASTNGAAGIPVENPATGEVITTVPAMSAEEVKRARRARAARRSPSGRRSASRAARGPASRAEVGDRQQPSGSSTTIVAETGKTYEDAQLAEISYVANAFGFWAKNGAGVPRRREGQVRASCSSRASKLIVRYAPLGVVGVIGPWNYPLTNSFGDCIPALAAGNAVILKPREMTPLTSLLMAEVLRECGMPDDVFQVATGERRRPARP